MPNAGPCRYDARLSRGREEIVHQDDGEHRVGASSADEESGARLLRKVRSSEESEGDEESYRRCEETDHCRRSRTFHRRGRGGMTGWVQRWTNGLVL